NFRFCALALETTGGVGEEGLSFLRQLWRFGARQQNTKLCVYAGRAWARLSCNLQTSVAQAILHRVPTGGHPPARQRAPAEVSVVGVPKDSQVSTLPSFSSFSSPSFSSPSFSSPSFSCSSSFSSLVSVSSSTTLVQTDLGGDYFSRCNCRCSS